MEYATCFITGHRPHRLKFKYNENYKLCIKIKKALKAEILRQYTENNVRQLWVGGAVGVDCWAGEIIYIHSPIFIYPDKAAIAK